MTQLQRCTTAFLAAFASWSRHSGSRASSRRSFPASSEALPVSKLASSP